MPRSLRFALVAGILILVAVAVWLMMGIDSVALEEPGPPAHRAVGTALRAEVESSSTPVARPLDRGVEAVSAPGALREDRRVVIRESDGRMAVGLAYWIWPEPPRFAEATPAPQAVEMPELPSSAGRLPSGGLPFGALGKATHLSVMPADDHLVTWSVEQLGGPVYLPARAALHCSVDVARGWRVDLVPLAHPGEEVPARHRGRALLELWQRDAVRASLLRLPAAREPGEPVRGDALQGRPFGVFAASDHWELEAPELAVPPCRIDVRSRGRAPILFAYVGAGLDLRDAPITLVADSGLVIRRDSKRRGAEFRDGLRLGMVCRLWAVTQKGERLEGEVTLDKRRNFVELTTQAEPRPPVRLGLPLDCGERPHTIVVYTGHGEFALQPDTEGPTGYRVNHTEVLVSSTWRDAEGFGAIWRDGRVARTKAYLHEPYLEWAGNQMRPGISVSAIYEHLSRPPEGRLVVLGTTRLEPVGTRWRRLQELDLTDLVVRSQPLLLTSPARHLRLRFEGPEGTNTELPLVGW